jgi:DNA ligase-associated metallophosphoesterase
MDVDGALAVEAGGQALWLLPGRAAFWPRASTLLVADIHLGKAAAFRRAGIPVPQGTTEENISRLSALVRACRAERIVFLGDLVHDSVARRAATATFVRWHEQHGELAIVLVRGNHDRRAGELAEKWNVSIATEPLIEHGLALCHIPQQVSGAYGIAGHLHPGVRLHGRGRDGLRLPCFWFTQTHVVLPAFGAFTGLAEIEPRSGDKVYVEAGEQIVPVMT